MYRISFFLIVFVVNSCTGDNPARTENKQCEKINKNAERLADFLFRKKMTTVTDSCVIYYRNFYSDVLLYSERGDSQNIRKLKIVPDIITFMDLDSNKIEISYISIDSNCQKYKAKNSDTSIFGFGVTNTKIEYLIQHNGVKISY
jgi:hypothetical protein